MSRRISFRACALGACVILFIGVASVTAQPDYGARQEQPKQEPQLSEAEAKAANKVIEATDAATKLQAAAEFLKKHAKSKARPRVAEHVAANIGNVQDAAQRITLVETYRNTFNGPGEADFITLPLLDAYIMAPRNEDAFRLGAEWLQKHPEDIDTMRRLTIVASNAAISGNNAFAAQGQQYGLKAAELIEADKKPADFDPAKWGEYKTRHLPLIYREVGVIALRTGDKAAARKSMEKAAAHKSTDPIVYLLLSDVANEEYNQAAKEYQAMPEGAEKAARRKKIEDQLDRVIEVYAQTVAMLDGNAQYDQARVQLKQDLDSYYKYRHNNSTQGLQELIDKYKKAAVTP